MARERVIGGGYLYTARAREQLPPPPRWPRVTGSNGPSGPRRRKQSRLCAEEAWQKPIPYLLLGESKLVVLQLIPCSAELLARLAQSHDVSKSGFPFAPHRELLTYFEEPTHCYVHPRRRKKTCCDPQHAAHVASWTNWCTRCGT